MTDRVFLPPHPILIGVSVWWMACAQGEPLTGAAFRLGDTSPVRVLDISFGEE